MSDFNKKLQFPQPDTQFGAEESRLFIQYLLNCLANAQPKDQCEPKKPQQINNNVMNEIIAQNDALKINPNDFNLYGRKLTGNRSILNGNNFENSLPNTSTNSSVNSPRTISNSSDNDLDPALNSSDDFDPTIRSRTFTNDSLIQKNSNYVQLKSNMVDLNSNSRTNKFYPDECYQRPVALNLSKINQRTTRTHSKQANLRSNFKSLNSSSIQPNPRLNAKQQRVFKEILLEIEIKKHQQQLMAKYGGKCKYEFKYIVDHDGLLPKGTSSFRMRIPQNSSCSFCANNNLPEEFARSHILKDPNNMILCPMLQCYECPICRATGIKSHTVRYCQMNRQLALERAKLILNMMHPANNQIYKNENDQNFIGNSLRQAY